MIIDDTWNIKLPPDVSYSIGAAEYTGRYTRIMSFGWLNRKSLFGDVWHRTFCLILFIYLGIHLIRRCSKFFEKIPMTYKFVWTIISSLIVVISLSFCIPCGTPLLMDRSDGKILDKTRVTKPYSFDQVIKPLLNKTKDHTFRCY